MQTPSSDDVRQLAVEVFMTTAGPRLVKEVANILVGHGIPVMPLKGVLLQRVVYGTNTFRHISDVDLLVPEDRFFDAHAALQARGFTRTHWERGAWQVVMRNPDGPPLNIDLHRRLTRTFRSRLTSAGMFARGTGDRATYGAPVVRPRADDLFAHVLQHATLHWLAAGTLHRPEDFQAIADALSLDVSGCANHLSAQGMVTHALVLLPLVAESTDGPFVRRLLDEIVARAGSLTRPRLSSAIVRTLCARFEVGSPGRRAAGPILSPSLVEAFASAARDRLVATGRRQ